MTAPTRAEILPRVVALIGQELTGTGSAIGETERLREELSCDSLDLFVVQMAIEEEFGVEIPDEDWDRLATPGAIADWLARRLAQAEAPR